MKFHRDGIFFFTSSSSYDRYQDAHTPTVTSQIPLRFEEYFQQKEGCWCWERWNFLWNFATRDIKAFWDVIF